GGDQPRARRPGRGRRTTGSLRREALPRREGDGHRGRHRADPAHRDRPPPDRLPRVLKRHVATALPPSASRAHGSAVQDSIALLTAPGARHEACHAADCASFQRAIFKLTSGARSLYTPPDLATPSPSAVGSEGDEKRRRCDNAYAKELPSTNLPCADLCGDH